MSKPVLGRGLGALLGGSPAQSKPTESQKPIPLPPVAAPEPAPGERVERIALTRIHPSPLQPRKAFTEESLRELADSIKEQGFIQPLIVRKRGDGYELIAGERRWRASQLIPLTEAPVIVREADDITVLELALIENLQRENLNALEEAVGYAQLVNQFKLTQEEVATKVGKSRVAVANAVRLLNLPSEVQTHLRTGRISTGHAKVILGLTSAADQKLAAEEIIRGNLSVRATEQLLAQWQTARPGSSKKPVKPGGVAPDAHMRDLQNKITQRLGAKVGLRYKGGKGALEIHFFNDAELERILEIMGVSVIEDFTVVKVNKGDVRLIAARGLSNAQARIAGSKVFAGLDGFVDEIVHVVDTRHSAEKYDRLSQMSAFAARIAEAAGRSTNIEMVNQRVKLGGNGPILANALAALGFKVTYLGALGYPHIHPVFEALSRRAAVHSIADPGHTQALEFEDGKLMLVKTTPMNDVTWENIEARFGQKQFEEAFLTSDLVTFVNWTMVPHMTELWKHCLKEFAPKLQGSPRMMFFDLADPAKRTKEDLLEALALVRDFEKFFHVTLGLNEKEAVEVAECFGIPRRSESQADLIVMANELYAQLGVSYLIIHPVLYAFVVHRGGVDVAYGPHITKALITTGAGDHFNAGFCMGKLLSLPPGQCISLGVATSGYYVKNGATPSLLDLISFLEQYPVPAAEEAA